MSHPKVYPYISDDGSANVEDFQVIESDHIIYLLWEGGVFSLVPFNCITYEVHTCILPEYQGKSLEYARAGTKWMFENTSCQKIITHVPEYNKRAYVFAKKSGMEFEGTSKKAFLKNGKLHDLHKLGISCHTHK